jgi:hypothetical protein
LVDQRSGALDLYLVEVQLLKGAHYDLGSIVQMVSPNDQLDGIARMAHEMQGGQ